MRDGEFGRREEKGMATWRLGAPFWRQGDFTPQPLS